MKKIILLFFVALGLAGCAVNTRYVSYTQEHFPAKERYYFVSIYPESKMPAVTQPYRLIGKVELSGHVGDGVNSDLLADEARAVARSKGADAIVNSRTEVLNYDGLAVIPGRCGYYHCRPTEYIPYRDTQVTFRGELAAFMPGEIKIDDAGRPTAP